MERFGSNPVWVPLPSPPPPPPQKKNCNASIPNPHYPYMSRKLEQRIEQLAQELEDLKRRHERAVEGLREG